MTDTSFSNPFLFSPGQQVNNEEEQFWGNLQSALSHGGSPIKDTGIQRTLNRIDTEERLVYEEIKKPSPMKLRAPDFLCQMNTSYSNLGKKQMHVSYRQEIERQNALLAQQKSRNTSYSCQAPQYQQMTGVGTSQFSNGQQNIYSQPFSRQPTSFNRYMHKQRHQSQNRSNLPPVGVPRKFAANITLNDYDEQRQREYQYNHEYQTYLNQLPRMNYTHAHSGPALLQPKNQNPSQLSPLIESQQQKQGCHPLPYQLLTQPKSQAKQWQNQQDWQQNNTQKRQSSSKNQQSNLIKTMNYSRPQIQTNCVEHYFNPMANQSINFKNIWLGSSAMPLYPSSSHPAVPFEMNGNSYGARPVSSHQRQILNQSFNSFGSTLNNTHINELSQQGKAGPRVEFSQLQDLNVPNLEGIQNVNHSLAERKKRTLQMCSI